MPSDGLLWRGLAAELRRDIAAGRYPVGTRLPSIAAVMRDREVSDSTVRQALRQLSEDGLVEARHGSGHWVIRDTVPADVERRLAELEQRVERLERERDA